MVDRPLRNVVQRHAILAAQCETRPRWPTDILLSSHLRSTADLNGSPGPKDGDRIGTLERM